MQLLQMFKTTFVKTERAALVVFSFRKRLKKPLSKRKKNPVLGSIFISIFTTFKILHL